jgi:hypothetical protein
MPFFTGIKNIERPVFAFSGKMFPLQLKPADSFRNLAYVAEYKGHYLTRIDFLNDTILTIPNTKYQEYKTTDYYDDETRSIISLYKYQRATYNYIYIGTKVILKDMNDAEMIYELTGLNLESLSWNIREKNVSIRAVSGNEFILYNHKNNGQSTVTPQ